MPAEAGVVRLQLSASVYQPIRSASIDSDDRFSHGWHCSAIGWSDSRSIIECSVSYTEQQAGNSGDHFRIKPSFICEAGF